MSIPASVIFVWPGTHAAIPAGWSRETSLDGLYPKGTTDGVNPNVTGGAATHTHTSPGHTHTMSSHTHVIDIAAANNDGSASSETGLCAANQHDHANFNSGIPNNVSVGEVAVTYAAFSNNPPYYEVVFMKPDALVSGLPNLAICFGDRDDDLGLTFCDGTDSSPDLRNKYLKGAAALGDAGGTGGTYTNTHSVNHAHTQTHGHVSATSGNATTSRQEQAGSGCVNRAHTHAVALPANTTGTATTAISLVTAETVEPAYKKLIPLQNRTGSVKSPEGMVGMWLGTLANIPQGWSEVEDMQGKHLKCANSTDDVLNTGGSNTHTHASQDHSHAAVSHTHIFTTSLTHTSAYDNKDPDWSAQDATATHAGATISSANYSLADSSTSAASSSNEPEYRTVAFIKNFDISQGAFILNLV